MFREINRFKEKTGKPVVVLMMDVAASGGYYLACSGDHIVAYPSTITGSIGVIIQTITFKEAMARLGIQADAITSGPNKAAGSPFETLKPEHRAILKKLVDDFYGRFSSIVRKARPGIAKDQFAMVTDGRIVSGVDAKKLGLVDEIGDLYNAHDKAKELAGIAAADLILYHRALHHVASPYATAPSVGRGTSGSGHAAGAGGSGTQINLIQLNLGEISGGAQMGFYYLWQSTIN
jgi:protease-4